MFLPASRHFDLSEETVKMLRSISLEQFMADHKSKKNDGRHLKPAAVIEHARECRRQTQKKWANFQPGSAQLCNKRYYNVADDEWVEERIMVEIDQEPFGKGAIRECFRMKEVNLEQRLPGESTKNSSTACSANNVHDESPAGGKPTLVTIANGLVEMRHMERRRMWVAKRAMQGHADLEAHRRDCRVDVMHQAMAKYSAEQYNAALRKAVRTNNDGHYAHQIDFLMTHMIEFEDGRTYGSEAFLFGDYKKHNNNSGGTMGGKKTPQTFSYFTFINSGRRRMIVDIQGIDDLYTDPVVHFLPSHANGSFKDADSPVNLGIRGFALFLWSHRYNEVDRTLKLPVFPMARSELETPVSDKVSKITDLNAGRGIVTLTSRRTVNSQGGCKGFKDGMLALSAIPDVDLRPESWVATSTEPVRVMSATSKAPVLPLELIEASCHMEIAAMYDEGRLSAAGSTSRTRDELEAAVFHLAEAANQGLPEALMAFARLASNMDHQDFLPQVTSSEKEAALCLALLERAASMGVVAAHGALARLMLDGGYGSKGTVELKAAAGHLELFAERTAAQPSSSDKESDDEPLKHEVCCKHGGMFGWEAHGWESHSAYARAAELYEAELRQEEDSWTKARELWSLAAECALEDPRLSKQAMRYMEEAEREEPPLCDEAPAEPVLPQDGEPKEDDDEFHLCVKGDLALRLKKFAAGFATADAALETLLQSYESQSRTQKDDDSNKPPARTCPSLVNDTCDEDIWSMIS